MIELGAGCGCVPHKTGCHLREHLPGCLPVIIYIFPKYSLEANGKGVCRDVRFSVSSPIAYSTVL